MLNSAPHLPVDDSHESLQSFSADLPELLREHRGEWVAYLGKQRLGIEKDGVALQARLEHDMKKRVSLFYIDPLDVDESFPLVDF